MRWIITCSGLAVSSLWLATASFLMPASGWAQDAKDEIIVTARKREESLQEVPISIIALSDKQLRERNIDNVYDVANFTPNFNMSRNLGRRLDRPIIRGMFPPGRGRANAGFFVDGAFLPGEFGSISTTSLDNLQRVEVYRGPQAALFGRATFAGAVNYITRDILDVWEGEINTRAGSEKDYKLSAWASGPIIEDKLKVYVGAGAEGWDGEWRNNLQPGQANASNDPATSLDFFNGPRTWSVNIPDIAGGEAPCPPGYQTFAGGADAGCPPQRGDNSKLGGEALWNTAVKFEFTPTDNLEFNVKAEYAQTDDDHFAAFYYDPVFAPVNGVQLAPGHNCQPPVYDPDNEIYIPSTGWHCGELSINQARAQINMPNFAGVATCPPGSNCVLRDGGGTPILDANGNVIPTIVSPPAPFVGAQTQTERYLAEMIYNFRDWEFLARATLGQYEENNVRDLERSYSLGPVTTGLFEGFSRDAAETKSAEFTVSSPAEGRLRGLLGYYYYHQEAEGKQRRFNSFSDGFMFGFSRQEEEENYAIFGSAEYDLTEQVSLTFDWRYAEDTLTQFAPPELLSENPDLVPLVGPAEETFYSFTPRFIVDYHPNEDLNFYFSVAKGNKPGGFNGEWFDDNVPAEALAVALGQGCEGSEFESLCRDAIVEEEETWNWEIGAKTSLMDNRLIANAALFYIDWTNQGINVNQCIPRSDATACEDNLGVVNAGESRIYGAELEFTYAATDNLTLGLAYGLADTKLEDYFDDGIANFSCNYWDWLQGGDVPDCEAQGPNNANGNESELVPKHSANFSAIYTRGFRRDMDWFVKSYLNYESKKYVTVANLAELGDIYIWNTSAGLQGDRWEVTAYLNNILDDDTPTIAFDFPIFDNSKVPALPGLPFFGEKVQNEVGFVLPQAFILTPRRGRHYGVTAQYRFGG